MLQPSQQQRDRTPMKIYTKDYKNIWFTSDQHMWHKNVLSYCKRPFASVVEMNEALIKNYNDLVDPADIVFHVGDFSFGTEIQTRAVYNRLNGQKHLICGNHDKFRMKFMSEHEFLELKVVDEEEHTQNITLCHYAMRTWNKSHHGAWQLFGHSHGTLTPIGKQHDVGVDNNNYAPVSFNQLKDIMSKIAFIPVDHHD